MFASIDNLRDTASVGKAFGEPQEAEGKIIIPVAEVGLGFGLGFGQGTTPETEEAPVGEGEGGGGGGGANARPIAIIEISKEETIVKPIVDESKITLAAIAMVAWCIFWLMATLRAIFGEQ
ncbi:MAG: hypothetical protein JXA89_00645 [Anaerolineae bacterium]|nr:hypothetical protein [Anaerolineae bacterium]